MRKILFPFNVLKNNCVKYFFLLIICSILNGGNQEIDSYIDSVLTGYPKAGSQMLSRLLDSYPNHPGVMYLQGLHELNGEIPAWTSLGINILDKLEGSSIIIPDIESVNYGRGVGYDIIEHIPPDSIGKISATKIRKKLFRK